MAPERWPVVFLLERTGRAGSGRCQEKRCGCQPGSTVKSKTSGPFVTTEGSSVIRKKKYALSSCNCVSVFVDTVCVHFVFHGFCKVWGEGVAGRMPNI